MKYYILCLKRSHSEDWLWWWKPRSHGHTQDLNEAGVYPQEMIDADPNYYNDGRTSKAIPVERVQSLAREAKNLWGEPIQAVSGEHLKDLKK